MDDLVERMEKMSLQEREMTFDELPDIALMQIIGKLDLRSRLRMRLNKRLDRLQLEVKDLWEEMVIKIAPAHCRVEIDHRPPIRTRNFDSLALGLRRLALNTDIGWMCVKVDDAPNEKVDLIFDALTYFNAAELSVEPLDCKPFHLPQANLDTLLHFAQHLRSITMGLLPSLTAHDLCVLRKTILEGECPLTDLWITVESGMNKKFVSECFAVDIVDTYHPRHTRIYRTLDEHFELYATCSPLFSNLHHFEGGLHTTIASNVIDFTKRDAEEKTDHKYKRIAMMDRYHD